MQDTLYSMLSKMERDTIEDYIEMYSGNNDINVDMISHPRASLDRILAPWEKAKSRNLVKLLDGKLILRRPVSFEKGIDELIDDMAEVFSHENSTNETFCNFNRRWYDEVCTRMDCYASRRRMERLVGDYESLVRNKYEGTNFEIPLPDGTTYTARCGTKLMRIIRKVAMSYNITEFDEFQRIHSLVLNDKQFHGDLCISIHPMDYMTMSDNDCDWESCMSWQNDGCYRRGTVEMMNSDSVVVAYLTAKHPMYFSGPTGFKYTWNNKKWRCLFIVTPQVICDIKAYPYHSGNLISEVLNILKEKAEENLGWTYQDHQFRYTRYDTFSDEVNEYTFHFATDCMYNDTCDGMIGYVSDKPMNTWDTLPQWEETPGCCGKLRKDFRDELIYQINYSGLSECMWCGSTENDFEDEALLLCEDCVAMKWCEHCEHYTPASNGEYIDGEWFCSYCLAEMNQCENCGAIHFDSEDVEIHMVDDNDNIVAVIRACSTCCDDLLSDMLIDDKKRYASRFYCGHYLAAIKMEYINDYGWHKFYNNCDYTELTFAEWKEAKMRKHAPDLLYQKNAS